MIRFLIVTCSFLGAYVDKNDIFQPLLQLESWKFEQKFVDIWKSNKEKFSILIMPKFEIQWIFW
jgi:hypothetical protein